jgi:DNA-binding transcriptional LysR family regulator
VLAGQVIAQVSNLSAAAHIRAGRLVPRLLRHLSDHIGVHLYYGSRNAQPRRVLVFIDLAVKRLRNNPEHVLGAKELAEAAKGRRLLAVGR